MQLNFPLFPDQASTVASQVDALYYFLVAVSSFFSALIFFLVIYFAVKYRQRSEIDQPAPILSDLRLEVLWTVIPLVLVMIMFAWGASLFFHIRRPPAEAIEIYVVGKQWMWKLQHPQGQREVNELHVPVGRPVKLTMTSEDVIHSFYIPAFRIKMDALPGRYTTAWFEATQVGEYHLFCAEYCGTQHSGMIGRIVVMEPAQYQQWLSGNANTGGSTGGNGRAGSGQSLASVGAQLFQQLRCHTCHVPNGVSTGPTLVGLFGKSVPLQTGETVTADEDYVRESILNPAAKIVARYHAVMPTYTGQVSEEGLVQLIAHLKSLEPAERTQAER